MAEEKKDQNQAATNQINIELPEEIAEGEYTNLAMVAHSNSEFVVDFIRLMPGVPKAKVKSRVERMTSMHDKRYLWSSWQSLLGSCNTSMMLSCLTFTWPGPDPFLREVMRATSKRTASW